MIYMCHQYLQLNVWLITVGIDVYAAVLMIWEPYCTKRSLGKFRYVM